MSGTEQAVFKIVCYPRETPHKFRVVRRNALQELKEVQLTLKYPKIWNSEAYMSIGAKRGKVAELLAALKVLGVHTQIYALTALLAVRKRLSNESQYRS